MRIIRFVRPIFEPYVEGIKLLCLGVRELMKLVCRFPVRSVFVICITTAFTVIGYILLFGSEFQFLPLELRVAALCTLGISLLIGSVSWSIRLFG